MRAPVASLLWEKGRVVGVVMRRGEVELRAPVVISAAGFVNTFERLVPKDAQHLIQGPLRTLRDNPSFVRGTAHLSLSVALRGDKDELQLPASNLWITPGPAHDRYCDAYAANPDDEPFPAVFLSFPSAKEPTWAERFPGKSTCQMVADGGSWERWHAWADARVKHRGAEYEALKARLSEKLLDILFREFPQLRGKVEFSELGTPLTSSYCKRPPHPGHNDPQRPSAAHADTKTPCRHRHRDRPRRVVRSHANANALPAAVAAAGDGAPRALYDGLRRCLQRLCRCTNQRRAHGDCRQPARPVGQSTHRRAPVSARRAR